MQTPAQRRRSMVRLAAGLLVLYVLRFVPLLFDENAHLKSFTLFLAQFDQISWSIELPAFGIKYFFHFLLVVLFLFMILPVGIWPFLRRKKEPKSSRLIYASVFFALSYGAVEMMLDLPTRSGYHLVGNLITIAFLFLSLCYHTVGSRLHKNQQLAQE